MDFYTRQAQARRQTRWLVIAFIIALAAVVLTLDAVLFTLMASGEANVFHPAPLEFARRNPGTALVCTLIILAVLGFASIFKSLQLRQGGGVVARSLGGLRVDSDVRDFKIRRLHNVVEEMAIASGVPKPEVYVLENETAINAFAAGHTPANAAVAVTRGALDRLNREQLQGVIAHEFSHILNGDMRLNVQLMGWVFGLLVLALIGRTVLRVAPRSRKGAGGVFLFALVVMVLGYVGMLATRILQAAVSRQRERLADASAVQFTRNPDGLKEALLKIAGVPEGSKLGSANAEQVAHMLFAQGLTRVFATHPPIAERIQALDPSFRREDLERLAVAVAQQQEVPPPEEVRIAAFAPNDVPAEPATISQQVGVLDTLHIDHAHSLRLALPEEVRGFVTSADRARTLVLALLLSHDARIREAQLSYMAKHLSPDALAELASAYPLAATLEPMLRLPAVLQFFPAIRALPESDRRLLVQQVDDLIRADARIDVFEFCLAHLLETLVTDELEARVPHMRLPLDAAQSEIQTLLSVLASAGARDEAQARKAYEAGMHTLFPMHRPPYVRVDNWPERLSRALERLDQLLPFAKKALIEALVKTIAHDDVLHVTEAELLRTVCARLHCPLPPLLPPVSAR